MNVNFIDHNHNRCSDCLLSALTFATTLFVKLSFTLLRVSVLIPLTLSSYRINISKLRDARLLGHPAIMNRHQRY